MNKFWIFLFLALVSGIVATYVYFNQQPKVVLNFFKEAREEIEKIDINKLEKTIKVSKNIVDGKLIVEIVGPKELLEKSQLCSDSVMREDHDYVPEYLVDWGDGPSFFVSKKNNELCGIRNLKHAYTVPGDYLIEVKILPPKTRRITKELTDLYYYNLVIKDEITSLADSLVVKINNLKSFYSRGNLPEFLISTTFSERSDLIIESIDENNKVYSKTSLKGISHNNGPHLVYMDVAPEYYDENNTEFKKQLKLRLRASIIRNEKVVKKAYSDFYQYRI